MTLVQNFGLRNKEKAMKVKTPLALYLLLFTLSSAAIAQQNRTAIYGRVIGSDHRNDVPTGWVVRVTAFRVDNGQRVDQRDSVAELYCLTVPTNSIVRLTFETSYHPPGELGYSSTRLPTPIDTRPDDRQATVRAQPDVVLSRKIVHHGASARDVIQQELNADLDVARETGSMDIVMANFKSYRRAYSSNQQIMMDLNTAELNLAGYPAYKLFKGAPFAPATAQVEAVMREAYEKFKNETEGKNADYIPYLAKVDSKLFGIALVSTDNQVLTMGDVNYSFSIQSISKVFSQALAMQELGAEKVFEKVGNEPTGRGFNSVFAVADMPTHTGNPYVNAGAIATVSLISGKTADKKWEKIVDFYSRVAGEKLKLIDEVYESEAATNAGNKALSMLLAKYDRIYHFTAMSTLNPQNSMAYLKMSSSLSFEESIMLISIRSSKLLTNI
jgi:hypothetical protein